MVVVAVAAAAVVVATGAAVVVVLTLALVAVELLCKSALWASAALAYTPVAAARPVVVVFVLEVEDVFVAAFLVVLVLPATPALLALTTLAGAPTMTTSPSGVHSVDRRSRSRRARKGAPGRVSLKETVAERCNESAVSGDKATARQSPPRSPVVGRLASAAERSASGRAREGAASAMRAERAREACIVPFFSGLLVDIGGTQVLGDRAARLVGGVGLLLAAGVCVVGRGTGIRNE